MKTKHKLQTFKKAVICGLVFASLCLAGGCGNPANDPATDQYDATDMVGTGTDRESSVLDQGGANGTDNSSIMDYLESNETIQEEESGNSPFPSSDSFSEDANDLIDDIGDAAGDLKDDVEDGVESILTPSQTWVPGGNTTGTTTR